MQQLFNLRYGKLERDIAKATAAKDDYAAGRAGPAKVYIFLSCLFDELPCIPMSVVSSLPQRRP